MIYQYACYGPVPARGLSACLCGWGSCWGAGHGAADSDSLGWEQQQEAGEPMSSILLSQRTYGGKLEVLACGFCVPQLHGSTRMARSYQ